MTGIVQQILPADGWRAVYAGPSWNDSHEAFTFAITTEPLVGWALYNDESDNGPPELVGRSGQSLLGMVRDDGRSIKVELADDRRFLGYCAPGEDPESEFRIAAQDWLEATVAKDPSYFQRWARHQESLDRRKLDAPTLDAYSSRGGWEVWCIYCTDWHKHGATPGHRVAHCDSSSPYKKSGYILQLAGEMTPEIKRAKRAGNRDSHA